jgi:hypothetical protein
MTECCFLIYTDEFFFNGELQKVDGGSCLVEMSS